MRISRRRFVQASAAAAAAAAAQRMTVVAREGHTEQDAPPAAVAALKPFAGSPVPISDEERRARIEKARQLMVTHDLDAIVLEPGTSLRYFVGVSWGTSERPFLLVIPAKGELAYVAPGFEEARAREVTRFSDDVRVWQEEEDWGAIVAGILRDRGVATGAVGIEERVRFFVADGLRAASPASRFILATPVTAGCRMIKSPAEIALMQQANDITIAAYRAVFASLSEGMTQFELGRIAGAAFDALGAPGEAFALFGEYSAFPHGTVTPQRLKRGDVVLVDGGCSVEGYESDITRTTVFGTPTKRQADVWHLEKAAQTAAFEAAQVGATCESVDAAARKVITAAGFGPGYKVPGLPHRTGHGIGMDGHEWTNFVAGNTTKIAPGMCFSDEPMIAIYGEFGIRLEDCLYITESGPRFFSQQSPAIDTPLAVNVEPGR
jgi:Xaa-Pro dipeptidase